MKSDDAYIKELQKTIQWLDQTVNKDQREALRNSSLKAIESMSQSLSMFAHYTDAISDRKRILEIAAHSFETASESIIGSLPRESILEATRAQLESFVIAEQFAQTDMLSSMKSALLSFDWTAYCSAISKGFGQSLIDATDLSYLKLSKLAFAAASTIELPKGVSTAIKNISVSTATRLAKTEDISYETRTGQFFDEKNPDATANTKEMNVICSAADLFDDMSDEIINETELMNFMTVLQDRPGCALIDETAHKIIKIVKDLAIRINFDSDIYYHARARNNEDAPYTYDQMLTAPSGVTGPGRYNHPGQAFYYFSNTKEGAVKEVSKHEKDKVMQVAVVSPKRGIDMIDLSGSLRRGATFLRYIRFRATERIPKEYLIPCFVSDCCRLCGIEGIKYYGSKTYDNYVCWENGYFKFIRME